MKQTNFQNHHDTDEEADNTLRNSSKICADMNTVASSVCTSTGSYDTTEDLTDTDVSSQEKNSRRKNKSTKKDSSGNNIKGSKSIDGKIRFSMKAVTVFDIESHEHFSAKERGNYWWSDREKDRMMAKHERLVAKYEQSRSATKPGTTKKSPAEKIGSYRGLESWTAAGSLKLDYTIEQCISAVMDEQDRQWNENDDDADVIAKKSQAVTEDSARRARLNGLQDAQEALKVRGESWSKKGGSDEISVGSAISTGTVALVKKKKRSKLLARLDDSHNNKMSKSTDSSDTEDALASFKKSSSRDSKKEKKKKKKSSKKSLDENMSTSSSKTRKKKSKSKDESVQKSNSSILKEDTTEIEADSGNTKTTQSITFISKDPPDTNDDVVSTSATTATPISSQTVSSFSAGPSVPVSPLSTQVTSNHSSNTDEYPLLATLRRQQQQLLRSDSRDQDLQQTVIEDDDGDDDEDDDDEDEAPSDLLSTLRRQQKKQALSWQNQQQYNSGGNSGIPSYSGGPISKDSSLRFDQNKGGDPEPAKYSDPPGRRPRRLASRHSGTQDHKTPDNSSHSEKKNRSRSRSHDRYEKRNKSGRRGSSSNIPTSSGDLESTPESPDLDGSNRRMSGSFTLSPASGKKSLKGLRNGAKTFFKKSPKK